MNEMIKSRKLKIAAMIIGSMILVIIIFSAGVFVGFKKARFSYSWGENYERNFMGSRRGPGGPMDGPMGFMRGFEGRDFRNGHGIAGAVISITDNSLVMTDRDNKENTINVTDKTIIKNGRDDIKLGDIKTGDRATVIGRPGENGAVNADLIRIFNNIN